MISFQEAKQIAIEEIQKSPHNFVLLENKIIESESGWVFSYVPKKYLESKDFKDLVPGSAPFIVNRYDRKLKYFGTALPYTIYLKEYEDSIKLSKNR